MSLLQDELVPTGDAEPVANAVEFKADFAVLAEPLGDPNDRDFIRLRMAFRLVETGIVVGHDRAPGGTAKAVETEYQ
jgi:hypothetical protein